MRTIATAWAVAALLFALPATAQDIDDLEDLDEGVVLESPFEPGVEPNAWEVSLYFGNISYATVLLEADGIVVDVEDPVTTVFGDMKLEGQSSFSPQLRLGRTLGRHLALEASFGIALGDFEQTATNFERWTDPNDDETLSEVEREKGSYFVYTHELAAAYYPRGEGRLQPYIIGGVGQTYWELDSNYVDGLTSALSLSYGAGLRIVGDDLYSFRLEVRQYRSNVQFDVADTFSETVSSDDQLVGFPVSRLVDFDDLNEEQRAAMRERLDLTEEALAEVVRYPWYYDSYDEQTFNALYISAGFTAAF